MAPILSQGDLATVTPDTTNPDITSPKFASEFRPARQADLFPHSDYGRLSRARDGPVPNQNAGGEDWLCARRFGGIWRRPRERVRGWSTFRRHEHPGPRLARSCKQADYTTAITKIKAIGPQALFYGGDLQAGVKAG